MDALSKALVLLAVAIAVLSPLCIAEDSDGAEMDGLKLYQVNPKTCEGVSVHNYGSSSVDMKDYTISDMPANGKNEGTLSFGSIVVGPGETLVLASEKADGNYFSNQDNVVFYKSDERVTVKGTFVLGDSGDDVYLYKDGTLVDAVCYGNKTITDSSAWNGDPVKIYGKRCIERVGSSDTDSASDWIVQGRTSFTFDADLQYDATVTPFLLPNSGGIPVLRTLESAEKSIRVEIYMISDKNVLSLLVDKAEAGVDVDVLLEANPLGMTSLQSCSAHLMALIEAGADVRLIDSGTEPRYAYDHAKFAIVDGDTTVVMSENWTSDNLNGSTVTNIYGSKVQGNRGWGVVVESEGYASFMNGVFENDWSMEYGDVATYASQYPNVAAGETYYVSPTSTADFPSYKAKVTPVLSNESSYAALEYYASIAKERLYSQQQSLDSSYKDYTTDGPVGLFHTAALRGVDTKVIFSDQVDETSVFDINAKTAVSAARMTSPYVHNKGVVCDDYVWVSSVNWTENSFFNNREACVVINSSEVADFYASAFQKDFGNWYTYGGFSVEITEFPESLSPGKEYTASVGVTPSSGTYTYVWDLGDGSAQRTTSIGRIVFEAVDGQHTMTVRITDADGVMKTVTKEYRVGSSSSGDSDDSKDTDDSGGSKDSDKEGTDFESLIKDKLYIVLIVIVILLSAIGAVAKNGSKNKRKGKRR